MSKIILKDFRPVRELKLPASGITVHIYPSVLVGDMQGLTVAGEDFEKNLTIISKVIKDWDAFENEGDENPLPISVENLKKLSATDFEWLTSQIQVFANEQKKSSEVSPS